MYPAHAAGARIRGHLRLHPRARQGGNTTIRFPRDFSGRVYFSLGEKLKLFLTPDGFVQPAPWAAGDANQNILFDWSEFTYDDSGLWLNSSQVDMFAIPHAVTVTNSAGVTKRTGDPVDNGRDNVINTIRGTAGWSGLVYTRSDGTVLRVLSPSKTATQPDERLRQDDSRQHGRRTGVRVPVRRRVRLRLDRQRRGPALGRHHALAVHRGGGTTPPPASGVSLISSLNNRCIDVPGANFTDRNQLQVYDCNNTNAQKWTFGGGALLSQNGKCMDVADGSTANGAAVRIYTCNNTGAQQFVLSSAGDLVNVQANKCVDIKDMNSDSGAKLQLRDCAGTANQKWRQG